MFVLHMFVRRAFSHLQPLQLFRQPPLRQ